MAQDNLRVIARIVKAAQTLETDEVELLVSKLSKLLGAKQDADAVAREVHG